MGTIAEDIASMDRKGIEGLLASKNAELEQLRNDTFVTIGRMYPAQNSKEIREALSHEGTLYALWTYDGNFPVRRHQCTEIAKKREDGFVRCYIEGTRLISKWIMPLRVVSEGEAEAAKARIYELCDRYDREKDRIGSEMTELMGRLYAMI